MIGIIGAMEEEIAILRSALQNIQEVQLGPFCFYEGTLDSVSLVLLRCGIGKVNAAVGCALLIERYKPRLIINTGSAGGLDPALQFGDLVVSSGLVYHDVDVTAFSYAYGQVPGQDAIFSPSDELIAAAEGTVETLKANGSLPQDIHMVRGLIGSGDIFLHDPARIAAVRSHFPTLSAVEMEGAAIAHCCSLFKVPFLVIRALSDIAGAESPLKFEEFLPIAAKHSSAIVRELIKKDV
ncbi:5'-methylthioadenosine/S-adenosylhomocysteine nucleosidase [Treponema sp.]